MDIKEILTNILVKRGVDKSKINDNASMTSLGLDSLDLVEVMLEVEETLHVEFTSDEIANLVTFKEVVEVISKKVK